MSTIFRITLYLLIVFSVIFLAFHSLSDYQYYPGSDEGYYFRYAQQIAQQGIEGYQKIVQWYASQEQARHHPTPTRIGYILPTAFLFKILGPSYEILGFISFLSFLGVLGVCFYFIQKYFDAGVAFCATALLSSSPLLLAMSRRALIDSMVNLTWMLCFWLFFEMISKPRLKTYILLLCCLAWALLVKESAIILLFFFVIFLFINRKQQPPLLQPHYFWGMIFIPLAIFSISLLFATGGWENTISALLAIFDTHFDPYHSNVYAIKFSSGPWYRYLLDFFLLSPIVTLLFLGYFFSRLTRKNQSLVERYLLIYFIVVFFLFSFLSHTKVVRFVIPLEIVLAVFAVLYIRDALLNIAPSKADRLIALFIGVLVILNWVDFYSIFVQTGLLDPISFHLLQIRKFIP